MNEMKTAMAIRKVSLFLIIGLCAACSSELPRLSAPQLEAINHNMRGIKAEARGNHELALEEFNEALRIDSALDNSEGSVVALVNISRVNRRIGNLGDARTAIDQAVELTKPADSLFGEVAFEKGCVELAVKNLPQALDWAHKSLAASPDKDKAAATNLLARVLYQEKQYLPAKEQAEKALSLSSQNSQPDEEANALRLLGTIHGEGGRPREAIDSFSRALQQDKTQGNSKKIAADLEGLARVHAALKQNAEALDYYRRALSVNRSNGDASQAADNLLQMAGLLEVMGNRAESNQLLHQRENLLKTAEPPEQPRLP